MTARTHQFRGCDGRSARGSCTDGKLGGRALAGRGSFSLERAGCTWRMPENARGERVVGSVMVAFQGTTAKRSFRVTVR